MEAVDLEYMTTRELSLITGLSVRRIQQGIARARQLKIELASIWQVEWIANHGRTFKNTCEIHGGPDQEFPKGLPKGCLGCLKSGLDHLIHVPLKPPPDPEHMGTKYVPPPKPEKLTRKQNRAAKGGDV